jgi:hypothetical protein
LLATKINGYTFDVQKFFNFLKIKLVQPKKPVKAGLAVLSSIIILETLRYQIYLA